MKATNNPNINTKIYWETIYHQGDKRNGYWDASERFTETLKYIKDGDKVLDIGCGVGTLCKMVKKTYPNCEVWGTDIARSIIEENKLESPDINYNFAHVGSQAMLPNGYFDVVFSGEVLEHLSYPNDLFKDAQRVLKKGGIFICTTPLKDAIDSPEHVWFFEHSDIENLYLENGFREPIKIELESDEFMYIIFTIGEKI